MVAGCGNKCAKCMLFIFNSLFCISGAVIFGLALWVRYENSFEEHFEKLITQYSGTHVDIKSYYIALYIIASLGGLLFVCGFLGCCGAACESTFLLALYFLILLVLFIAELVAGIYILVKKESFKSQFEKWMQDTIIARVNKGEDLPDSEFMKSVHSFQDDLKCCGAAGCGDYTISPKTNACKLCGSDPPGCVKVVWDRLTQNTGIVAGIAIGILAIELLGMIFAMVLCCALRRGDYQ